MPSRRSFASFYSFLLCSLAVLALAAAPALAQDMDGDGYAVEDGDCADVPTPSIPYPQYVNPGAYDVPGNGIDDDCDGVVDNPPVACSASQVLSGKTGLMLAQALDLCRSTVESPPALSLRTWGVIAAEILRGSTSAVPGEVQSAVFGPFGTNVPPLAGATMAGLSSGTARDASDPGYVAPQSGYVSGVAEAAPAAFLAGNNGAVYRSPSCLQAPNTIYDAVRLRLRIRVPTNATGFSFQHRYFSAEWPDVCTPFNDHVVCLLTSAHPSVPANRNILFDAAANPVTVQTAGFQNCSGCPLGTGDLAGTGYDAQAATPWTTSSALVVPGETIVLEFVIWDSGDGGVDGLALFDDFRWITVEQPAGCDADSDGHLATSCGGGDCDDSNASVHPGAAELLDGLDNDCDGQVDDGFEAPVLRSIRDVKPDQGGAVRVRWRADLREHAYDPYDPYPRVTGYTLYRRVDGPEGAASAGRAAARAAGAAALALPPGEWDVLSTAPATLDSTYQTVAPTLRDSTAEGPCWSVFFVRALTDQVGTFYDSAPDSGYSVDDIAPGVPQGLLAQPVAGAVQLSWQPSAAADFQYFRVYRGADPGFEPSPATLVHATAGTSWSDPAPGSHTWKVTAVDAHGNESAPASASSTLDASGALPRSLAFASVAPNPARGRVALTIDVPEAAGRVELALFDAAGRRVRTLASGPLAPGRHTFAWDGRGEGGARLAPGIYVARLDGARRREARRLTLMP